MAEGLKPGATQRPKNELDKKGQPIGHGVYLTPDIDVAEGFASKFSYRGGVFKVVAQVRIKPDAIKVLTKPENYWIVNDPKDIRV